jgi:enoyl-CoA hydratase
MTENPPTPRIRYEQPSERVARVVLARPETRNAQDKRMLYELNAAFDRAMHDDAVRVVILAADGPDFSSGHDLRDREQVQPEEAVGFAGNLERKAVEGYFAQEHERFLDLCWRWRNLPKPTIAEVQGRVIAGGLMLVWPCDLIVASEDATFSDPVVAFGANGHEYFVHAWELGARKAKEMLFTGERMTAAEAKQLGMVNRVVARDALPAETLALAERIAARPGFGLTLAKQAVNQSQDAQGIWTALQAAFSLHQLGHAHNKAVHGIIVDPDGAELIRADAKRDS